MDAVEWPKYQTGVVMVLVWFCGRKRGRNDHRQEKDLVNTRVKSTTFRGIVHLAPRSSLRTTILKPKSSPAICSALDRTHRIASSDNRIAPPRSRSRIFFLSSCPPAVEFKKTVERPWSSTYCSFRASKGRKKQGRNFALVR